MDDFYRDNEKDDTSDSTYSYSYSDLSSSVHEGDYDARKNRSDTYYSYRDPEPNVYADTYEKKPRRGRHNPIKKGFGKTVLKCIVLAVIFGLVSGGIFAGVNRIAGTSRKEQASVPEQTDTSLEKTNTELNVTKDQSLIVSDVSEIVDHVMPSIVAITNMSETEVRNWFGQTEIYDSESCGSGIIVSDDEKYLYIATNNHVVADSKSLTICFFDNKTVAAEVKGTDEDSDLAVVSVKKSDLEEDTLGRVKVATLGDSDALKAGQSAIAIGNALGYGQSVTTGVISALNRAVTVTDPSTGNTTTNELVQTDAAINPGNSGGALLNIKGEVIGINSTKYADTDVEGMGYAIPMATAQPIIEELITREKVDKSQSAYLGIAGVDVTEEVSEAYNMPEGVYIAQVAEKSAADKAGIRKGDILVSFDGHKIKSMENLENQLQYYSAGTEVEIVIQRADDGEYVEKKINVTLGSKK